MRVLRGMHPMGPRPSFGMSSDASCSKNPGLIEFRLVDVETGKEIYRNCLYGTNNTGEFLGLVCAASYVRKHKLMPVYTDSQTAMTWFRKQTYHIGLPNIPASDVTIDAMNYAMAWVKRYGKEIDVRKWNNKLWGEIPADFGRKRARKTK